MVYNIFCVPFINAGVMAMETFASATLRSKTTIYSCLYEAVADNVVTIISQISQQTEFFNYEKKLFLCFEFLIKDHFDINHL